MPGRGGGVFSVMVMRRGVEIALLAQSGWAQGALAARRVTSAPTRIACLALAARSHGRGACTAVGVH